MAKKSVSEMTAEELEVRHAKAKERRANKRSNYRAAMQEIADLLPKDAELSDNAKHLIAVLTGTYTNKVIVDVNEGDSLIELLDKYKTVKDLYKKILKVCDEKGLVIKGVKIVKA